ncbi:MAG: hypothetical protein GF401_03230 [Chitinivibrionales bacterium]|nr:hypothetical protein [Chitinivibrionales bacterium]
MSLSLSCTNPNSVEGEMVSIAPPSAMTWFTPTGENFAAINLAVKNRDRDTRAGALAKRGATTAIPVTAVKVLSYQYSEEHHHSGTGDDYFNYYGYFWTKRDSAYWRWDNQVDYYRGSPDDELLQASTLEHSVEYATGQIMVKKGQNEIYIGFITGKDSEGYDSVGREGWATYYYDYENYDGSIRNGWEYYDMTLLQYISVDDTDTLFFGTQP